MNLFDSYNFKNRDTLPPGISPQVCKHTTIFNNCIYVGGISNELYAPEIFIEAVKSINESGKLKLTFTLVCREKELSDSYGIKKYLDEEWLNVVHTSDQNVLRDLYAKADFGISALKKTPYAHLCMPIKLGEYLSNGLPLITTDCVAIKEFVDDNKCGILCSDNGYSAKQAILEFYTKEEERLELYKNVEKTVLKNGWVSRVEKILNDLSKVK